MVVDDSKTVTAAQNAGHLVRDHNKGSKFCKDVETICLDLIKLNS